MAIGSCHWKKGTEAYECPRGHPLVLNVRFFTFLRALAAPTGIANEQGHTGMLVVPHVPSMVHATHQKVQDWLSGRHARLSEGVGWLSAMLSPPHQAGVHVLSCFSQAREHTAAFLIGSGALLLHSALQLG